MELPIPQNIIPLDSILPDEPLLMMGAGPVPIPARVAAANGIVINHLGDTMSQIIEQVKVMSRYVFQTQNGYILGVAGPGSAAMEMAIANIVLPGSKVLNICNGFFSSRLWEMSNRIGADTIKLQIDNANAASPALVEEYIITHKPDVVTIVQGETSNTVCNQQLPEIAKIAKHYGCLLIVDAVCTLSTMPLKMDEWGVDAVITGGQKGLSCIPGISLVGFSEQAWEHIQNRQDKLKHWCLDAKLADQFWNKNSYHYTAPVSGILAIHEALRLICIETLPLRFERHKRCSEALQAGIEAMGLTLHVESNSRLNSVVGINVPDGIESKQLLSQMSSRYRVEISGSFGPNIVRIGQMGEQCRAHNLFRTVHALGSCLNALGAKLNLPEGVASLEDTLGRANFNGE
ncbi:pyridoxal-phosphate-dependent aminotransferase family protein [Alteromonas sp. a30]|uniref:pyridoxal-phosphate-dependent aminotransferase family protein n=1 Tax=Alteromonas sp. a30 TaxID=2730917 RepID=UPI00227FF53B|nr:alanine--glyoxylate aminotransferase family protein [Alteromonas sp. a30]MCY7295994.1 alanine--glyoxylate aminotransferase family protein [Alteromonas sp. a30]